MEEEKRPVEKTQMKAEKRKRQPEKTAKVKKKKSTEQVVLNKKTNKSFFKWILAIQCRKIVCRNFTDCVYIYV